MLDPSCINWKPKHLKRRKVWWVSFWFGSPGMVTKFPVDCVVGVDVDVSTIQWELFSRVYGKVGYQSFVFVKGVAVVGEGSCGNIHDKEILTRFVV